MEQNFLNNKRPNPNNINTNNNSENLESNFSNLSFNKKISNYKIEKRDNEFNAPTNMNNSVNFNNLQSSYYNYNSNSLMHNNSSMINKETPSLTFDNVQFMEPKKLIVAESPSHSSTSKVNGDNSTLYSCTPNNTISVVLPDGYAPKIQNIVSTVNLKCELDLRDIALKARNAEYNPKRFAAVIMRIREPKTTALIFKSGKMVCTGAKSEEESRKAARIFAKTIQKIGYETVKFTDFTIQNIVGSCDLKFPIQIDTLYIEHAKFSQYEPEIFPGLIYRMFDPKVVLLIFASGKIVLTGAKKRSHIFDAYTKIVGTLQRFRKPTNQINSSKNLE